MNISTPVKNILTVSGIGAGAATLGAGIGAATSGEDVRGVAAATGIGVAALGVGVGLSVIGHRMGGNPYSDLGPELVKLAGLASGGVGLAAVSVAGGMAGANALKR